MKGEVLLKLENIDINVHDKYGYKPLHIACDNSIECSYLLLNLENIDPNVQNEDGNTPLRYAEGSFRLLLKEHQKINPYILNKYGH